MLFKKKAPKIVTIDGKKIELQPKPGLNLFKPKAKPAQKPVQEKPAEMKAAQTKVEQPVLKEKPQPQKAAQETQPTPKPQPQIQPQPAVQKQEQPKQQPQVPKEKPIPMPKLQHKGGRSNMPGFLGTYIQKQTLKHRNLEIPLKQHNIAATLEQFIERMFMAALLMTFIIGIMLLLLLLRIGIIPAGAVVLALAVSYLVYQIAFNTFINFPLRKEETLSRNIERDILFATRDMIISLRSGMTLYNAIVSISTGYGDASKEFAKITERAQIGMSLEEAIDRTITESKNQSFRRIMLQASASIKAGADIVAALQTITDQLSQERIIALRRYGQRLNAIAMFYMLFGVILPSMGIAILAILTTFISIFVVNSSVLEAALVGIVFLQLIFLQMIRRSRPVFAM